MQGRIVLNCSTEVAAMEDKGNRKHKFTVTCGGTSTPYEICADDNRSRNEWMLDISKVHWVVIYVLSFMSCHWVKEKYAEQIHRLITIPSSVWLGDKFLNWNCGYYWTFRIAYCFSSKAIQLEQALSEDSGQGINRRLARFYTLKYGTASPNLLRIDSTIRHTTIVSNPLKKEKVSDSSGACCQTVR